jgi:hypothetical protein
MKLTRVKIILLAALALAGSFVAGAQSNRVPGATDYPAFSGFVTDRNIFDPNRVPHAVYTSRPRTRTAHTRTAPSAPAFSLVGTMSYQKGYFAFFSGNDDGLKRVLPVAGKIAGYTVTQIIQGRVTLETTNQSEKLELKVGDVLRQENGKWALSDEGDLPAGTSSMATGPGGSSGGDNAPAPSPALGQNDVLKRLMELRAKENQ